VSFDSAKVPGGDVEAFGRECRINALDGVARVEWRPVYQWTKSWITMGGGAWLPDTWMLYAVSALLQRQPKSAVHSLDLGLRHWMSGQQDQAILAFCRGQVISLVMNDPKAAVADLEFGAERAPSWLRNAATDALGAARAATLNSRKRVPSVRPRPDHSPQGQLHATVAPPVGDRMDGEEPAVWERVRQFFLTDAVRTF
jgi:hypothetical protein